MTSHFKLPDELVITPVAQIFPCREAQIRALATLAHPHAAPSRNIVIHGTEATGKSAVSTALLEKLATESEIDLKYALVKSIECITARHLFERAIGQAADALGWETRPARCETVSQLTVELSKMLKYAERPGGFRFVLVFDAIDRQREAPPMLLPALGCLSEIIPNLTTIFIVTYPDAHFLRTSFVPHIDFPNYTKNEFVTIASLNPPAALPTTTEAETVELWVRFVGAVHDALTRSAVRTLPAFLHACTALWPRFTAPIVAGTHLPREFSKLLVSGRAHFHDETLLDPGIVPVASSGVALNAAARNGTAPAKLSQPDLNTLLPTTARLLLVAAYLASHNTPRHDLTLFSTHHHGKPKRRGRGMAVAGARTPGRVRRSTHRKIARKLLGAHVFVLERMLAIFSALQREWEAGHAGSREERQGMGDDASGALDADLGMAIATLASLRLLVRVSVTADVLDRSGKWRANVGWEVVRALGRREGIEVEEWLAE